MAKEFKITSTRLSDLEKELNYLKTTREREIAAMIAEARSYGDLSENSEYDAAKNEQAKLYGRIAEIEDILAHAVVIADENEASGRVGLGCTVTVDVLAQAVQVKNNNVYLTADGAEFKDADGQSVAFTALSTDDTGSGAHKSSLESVFGWPED